MSQEKDFEQRRCILRGVLSLIFVGFMLGLYVSWWRRLYGFQLGATTILIGILVKQLVGGLIADFKQALKLEVERQGIGE